eukprot:TRINITY_DN34043_c0_g1_i2.p2 TRINITY_DN34043_c0_g1~~TRINITY_DN34043_c0_g1_i2.p2  ORF type:complete len:308 (-),score=25.91 TRINITY_DN34043_c0_g1_i2:22-945(-)
MGQVLKRSGPELRLEEHSVDTSCIPLLDIRRALLSSAAMRNPAGLNVFRRGLRPTLWGLRGELRRGGRVGVAAGLESGDAVVTSAGSRNSEAELMTVTSGPGGAMRMLRGLRGGAPPPAAGGGTAPGGHPIPSGILRGGVPPLDRRPPSPLGVRGSSRRPPDDRTRSAETAAEDRWRSEQRPLEVAAEDRRRSGERAGACCRPWRAGRWAHSRGGHSAAPLLPQSARGRGLAELSGERTSNWCLAGAPPACARTAGRASGWQCRGAAWGSARPGRGQWGETTSTDMAAMDRLRNYPGTRVSAVRRVQ